MDKVSHVSLEELRGELCKQFNIILPSNDPVLVAAYLNEILLKKSLEVLHEQLILNTSEVLAQRNVLIDDEKEVAQKIITQSAEYIKKKLNDYVSDELSKIDLHGDKIENLANELTAANAQIIDKVETFKNNGFIYMILGASVTANVILMFAFIFSKIF